MQQKPLYIHSTEIHNTRAAEVIVPLIMDLFPVTSVLDVGCGLGTWMRVFQDAGVKDILGIDGDYVDKSKLVISEEHFFSRDLRMPFDLGRKFDLVISLEVAEHLPPQHAGTFISSLCAHSDRIIFSAAIPGQGGQNHLNEQWSTYWTEMLAQHGYQRIDAIRPQVWNLKSVDVWYRQNMFVYAKDAAEVKDVRHRVQIADIHPDLWLAKIEALTRLSEEVRGFDHGNAGVVRSFRALMNAIRNKLWKKP
ncbi:MAG TPA: methyltransferase domain-containing protein [Cyclobacteriaceae bacterium]|nr:methyltransferase domain-containing protein [Cyclobacteriaceae bacterium]